MMMDLSYYRIAKDLGLSRVHVMKVLKGHRVGQPTLDKVEAYLNTRAAVGTESGNGFEAKKVGGNDDA